MKKIMWMVITAMLATGGIFLNQQSALADCWGSTEVVNDQHLGYRIVKEYQCWPDLSRKGNEKIIFRTINDYVVFRGEMGVGSPVKKANFEHIVCIYPADAAKKLTFSLNKRGPSSFKFIKEQRVKASGEIEYNDFAEVYFQVRDEDLPNNKTTSFTLMIQPKSIEWVEFTFWPKIMDYRPNQ